MISRIQCRHYRSLLWVDQTLLPFQALVGPNACGKTTFLDVLVLLSDLMRSRGEVREAVAIRSPDFERLVWMGSGLSFQIAVEALIPEAFRARMSEKKRHCRVLRYEVEFAMAPDKNEIGLDHEKLFYLPQTRMSVPIQRTFFPEPREHLDDIFQKSSGGTSSNRVVPGLAKTSAGNDAFYPETEKGFNPSFKLGRTRSALANAPNDETAFPVMLWFRELLEKGVQNVILDSQVIKQPSPPGQGLQFNTDGSNLPWVIEALSKHPAVFSQWVEHVRTALEDIETIRTTLREEDRHRYLSIVYRNGAAVPSWLVSDGTLRLLALTLPAYLSDSKGMYLIEEPENGIHPRAVEAVVQSLTSVYSGQVMIATHSPVVLNCIEPRNILCLAKDKNGATDIISGDKHPRLREWKSGRPPFSDLFASGILS